MGARARHPGAAAFAGLMAMASAVAAYYVTRDALNAAAPGGVTVGGQAVRCLVIGLLAIHGGVLIGSRVVLRPARTADVEALLSILHEPEVGRRWGPFERADVEDQFVGDAKVFVIEVDGEVVGAIQYDEEEDPMYRHASIDIFLTTSRHDQGIGSEAIGVLAKHLIADRGHHRLTIDPAADNQAAIRAYEKVGFSKVGVMRSYERGPDGTWPDGLLMEMLADELVER